MKKSVKVKVGSPNSPKSSVEEYKETIIRALVDIGFDRDYIVVTFVHANRKNISLNVKVALSSESADVYNETIIKTIMRTGFSRNNIEVKFSESKGKR